MLRMITVADAQRLLREHGAARLTHAQTLPLESAAGLRLAEPVTARVFQPPADVSAMDGYAVRFADMAEGATLKIIDQSRAGEPFIGAIRPGEAVRIFTGAFTPEGCDHILIQEDATRDGDHVTVAAPQPKPSSVRRKGRDFSAGDTLVPAGLELSPGAVALSAAGNVSHVVVRRAPRVGVLANGDELVPPGSEIAPGQIVDSIAPALIELVRGWGCEPVRLGVSRDDIADVRARIEQDVDVVASIGGASVGDFDVVRTAFAEAGFNPVFEKVKVKPGKPTWFSARADRLALGLPGNPAAAMVTAQLFLRPLLDAMTGAALNNTPLASAQVTRALPATEGREEYLRAVLVIGENGAASLTPAEDQDSSLLSPFLRANALIRRPAGADACNPGDLVAFLPFN